MLIIDLLPMDRYLRFHLKISDDIIRNNALETIVKYAIACKGYRVCDSSKDVGVAYIRNLEPDVWMSDTLADRLTQYVFNDAYTYLRDQFDLNYTHYVIVHKAAILTKGT